MTPSLPVRGSALRAVPWLCILLLPASVRGQADPPSVSVFATAEGCPDAGQQFSAFGESFLHRLAFAQTTECDVPDPRLRTARAFALENSRSGVVRAQASGDDDFNTTVAIASAQATGTLVFAPAPAPTPGVFFAEISGAASGNASGGYIVDVFLPSGSFHTEVPDARGATGVRLAYPYVVPPGGFVGSFRVAVSARALNGSADFGRSAYAWVEGAPLDASDPGCALTEALPPMVGDVNRDGRVNAADLNVVRRNMGTTAAVFGTGDMNGDGDVDAGDLRAVREALGRVRGPDVPAGLSGLATPGAMPEPAAALLLLGAGASLLLRRSRTDTRHFLAARKPRRGGRK